MNPLVMKSGLILFILGGLLLSLVGKLKRIITQDRKKGILYLLAVLLVFGLIALVAYRGVVSALPLSQFIIMQLLFLAAGVAHQWAIDRHFNWPEEHHFWYKLLFTLAIAGIGSLTFSWVLSRVAPLALYYTFLPALLLFVIPFLVWETFIYALMIPVPVYKTWQYPTRPLPDPVMEDLRNPRVISLHFRKDHQQEDMTHFRVKAPEGMHFGTFFYYFINDYNASHPESPIIPSSGRQQTGWIFYHKPGFLSGPRHIDTEFTVHRNNIRENDVIICERVMSEAPPVVEPALS